MFVLSYYTVIVACIQVSHARRHVQRVLWIDVGEQRQRCAHRRRVVVHPHRGPQLSAAGRRHRAKAPGRDLHSRPPGRRGHDAAEPQRHDDAAAGRRPVPAPARARYQQQPSYAHARLRRPATTGHAGRQEQPDRRRWILQGVCALRPPEGAQHQR